MSEYARVHGYVSGRVQGVFFRYFTKETANQYGLTGWVRNLPDGRVEFVAEGQSGVLNDFVKDVKRGPASAHVSNLELEWEKYIGEYNNFQVRF